MPRRHVRLMKSSSPVKAPMAAARSTVSCRASALAALIAAAFATFVPAAGAAPYRAPGGPHPLFHGGDNQATYPPLATVAVEEPGTGLLPMRLAISCYPNPARGTASFRAFAAAGKEVRIRIYGVNGRLVREWQRNGAGTSAIEWTWDGRDGRGRSAGAGLYFYRAEAGRDHAQGKIVMLEGAR